MKGGNVFLCKFSLAFSIHSHSYLSFVGRVDDELLPGQMRMSEFENWYRFTCEGRSDKQRRWRRMWRRGARSGGPGEMGLNTEGWRSSSSDLTETGDVRERPGREENLSEGGGTSDNNWGGQQSTSTLLHCVYLTQTQVRDGQVEHHTVPLDHLTLGPGNTTCDLLVEAEVPPDDGHHDDDTSTGSSEDHWVRHCIILSIDLVFVSSHSFNGKYQPFK